MMKTKKIFSIAIVISLALTFSCKQQIAQKDLGGDVLWYPESTQFKEIIFEGSKALQLTTPKEYSYLGIKEDETISKFLNCPLKIKCHCSSNKPSSNCEHYIYKDKKLYCNLATMDCGRCLMLIRICDFQMFKGGFIKPDGGIQFAAKNDSLPYAFDAMLKVPDLVEKINDFHLEYYPELDAIPDAIIDGDKAKAPEGFEFVTLNTFGRALITLLPKGDAPKSAVRGQIFVCSCAKEKPNGEHGWCKANGHPVHTWYKHCTPDNCNRCKLHLLPEEEFPLDKAPVYLTYAF